MNENSKKHSKSKLNIAALIIQIAVTLSVILGLFHLSRSFELPQGLLGALLLFIVSAYISLRYHSEFKQPKRVGFIGLTISALILTNLFVYKHYVSDIRITIIHIGILLGLPLLLTLHLEKKGKKA